MSDVFMEKIVRRKRTGKDSLITIGLVIAVPVLFILLLSIPTIGQFISSMGLLIFAGMIYGAYHLIRSRNIEYEYIVTNGDLDIDMIIAQRKRKRVFSANCKSFDIIAKHKGSHYSNNMDNIKNRIEAVSSMDAGDIYFITLSYKGEQTIVFFQPQERMLDSFKRFIPRKVYKTDINIQ